MTGARTVLTGSTRPGSRGSYAAAVDRHEAGRHPDVRSHRRSPGAVLAGHLRVLPRLRATAMTPEQDIQWLREAQFKMMDQLDILWRITRRGLDDDEH